VDAHARPARALVRDPAALGRLEVLGGHGHDGGLVGARELGCGRAVY
jgi:hypothetical protein